MTNGFTELFADQMMDVDGGINWDEVGVTLASGGAAVLGPSVVAGIGRKIGGTVGTFLAGPAGTGIGVIVGGVAGVIIYSLWD